MTKAEEEFMFDMMEQLANYQYELGFRHARTKQPKREAVALRPVDKLTIRSHMALFVHRNNSKPTK